MEERQKMREFKIEGNKKKDRESTEQNVLKWDQTLCSERGKRVKEKQKLNWQRKMRRNAEVARKKQR